jgi:hypothetical protein
MNNLTTNQNILVLTLFTIGLFMSLFGILCVLRYDTHPYNAIPAGIIIISLITIFHKVANNEI